MLVREAGLEPARPERALEPESSESANSTTRASFVLLCFTALVNNSIKVLKCQYSFYKKSTFFDGKQKDRGKTPRHIRTDRKSGVFDLAAPLKKSGAVW